MMTKLQALKHYWGHDEFRDGQEAVIDALLAGRDALAVMPTGAGKSICSQLPAMLLPGVTLVVSPLISLMKDQVNALIQMGIPAAYLNSSLSASQFRTVLSRAGEGAYRILYVAPERLLTEDFLAFGRQVQISLLAVDEAHCISQWGQDFRPSYLKIVEFIRRLPVRPTVAAFTATATPEVKRDIALSLKLVHPLCLTTGFDRKNLYFGIRRPKDKTTELYDLLAARRDKSGIVYCATRKMVEELCDTLNRFGFSATRYHAGLSDEERRENQEAFTCDRIPIMVATNAFGMGIDKSNVSFVIHYNMPKNLESYYQEAGRAGRDGTPADCILLYSGKDVHINQFLIDNSDPNPELSPEMQEAVRRRDHERLRKMVAYSTGNACLRATLLAYFGENSPAFCGNCSSCEDTYETVDATKSARQALRLILETQQRYGRGTVTALLRGADTEAVRRVDTEGLKDFGALRAESRELVDLLMDTLLRDGFLVSTEGPYPVLQLTDKAKEILFGHRTVTLRLPHHVKKAGGTTEKTDPRLAGISPALYRDLRLLRHMLAEEQGVPAYIIFSDATLIDMCRKLPRTGTQLLGVLGVGQSKLNRYGDRFLKAIRPYLGNR